MHLHVVVPSDAIMTDATCVLLPIYEDGDRTYGALLEAGDVKTLEALAKRDLLRGKARETYFLPTPSSPYAGIMTLGLGKRDSADAETLRRVTGAACGVWKRQNIARLLFDASGDHAVPVEALVEGVILGQYDFTTYKKEPDSPPTLVEEIQIVVANDDGIESIRKGCGRTVLVCENANWARDLANTASNDLTPSVLAAHAEMMAKDVGCDCEILDEDEMTRLGMDALLGVSAGSSEPPRLILLHYRHEEASQTIALVGKGVTFDTGGISIKPAADMHEMKYDMCGAAAVLGAMKSICQMKPKVNVVCVVPTVENKTGADAQMPGDIVRAYNGKTVEVHNTDAEGRLILADAMAYTVDHYKPNVMVDVATLTGAVIFGLGHYAAGVMTNDDELVHELRLAADATGERIWQLPLWPDYCALIEGTHADLCNIGPRGEAGSITAGAFLKEFVGDTPWMHIDIAGTAWGAKKIPYLDSRFASGYGVRLLTQWVLDELRTLH